MSRTKHSARFYPVRNVRIKANRSSGFADLLHGPLLHLGGFVIPQYFWRRFSEANHGEFGEVEDMGLGVYMAGLFAGWIASLVALLWAADVWTRGKSVAYSSASTSTLR